MNIWYKAHRNIMDNLNEGLLTDKVLGGFLWQLRNELEAELLAEFDIIHHELKKSARREI